MKTAIDPPQGFSLLSKLEGGFFSDVFEAEDEHGRLGILKLPKDEHTAGGEEKWVWEQGIGIFSEDGELEALEGFITDISENKKNGLIKGGSKKNAIILNEEGEFENFEVMTWLNEPNLHKILDQIGDFYLADNMRIMGNIFSHKSGHASHLEFIHFMMGECRGKFEIVETE